MGSFSGVSHQILAHQQGLEFGIVNCNQEQRGAKIKLGVLPGQIHIYASIDLVEFRKQLRKKGYKRMKQIYDWEKESV